MGETRDCDYCGEEFTVGTGTTEHSSGRLRLTERFCSESCATDYEDDMNEDLTR